MWPNPQFPADLVTVTEESRNGKHHEIEKMQSKIRKDIAYLQNIGFI